MASRPPTIELPPTEPPKDPSHSAAFVFIHGFSDHATSLEAVAGQFRNANKLPYMQWVIPDAPYHHDAMEKAWYTPSSLSPFPSSRPELDDPEDEKGMMESQAYFVTLIDDLIKQGVPPHRIAVGGFSQGCAMSLLLGLTSKYAGKLGGIIGIAGYMPVANRIVDMRKEAGLSMQDSNKTPIFLCRGKRDMLVPKRYFTIATKKLKEVGVPEDMMELHEYEGMGHSLTAPTLRDVCAFLERVLPTTGP